MTTHETVSNKRQSWHGHSGSRARCLLLTDGSDAEVARRLTALAARPNVFVDPASHVWMPRGIADSREAKLGEEAALLREEVREALTVWWLAVRKRANTPNWDIASTCTIAGREGLLLVEAKAHAAELHCGGKTSGREENDARIAAAIDEANSGFNRILPGWGLTASNCYQLCNRFAWGWKLASMGIPIVLVYLGFLRANEMSDQGLPLADEEGWRIAVLGHASGLVPESAWEQSLDISGVPMVAAIRSLELQLPSEPETGFRLEQLLK